VCLDGCGASVRLSRIPGERQAAYINGAVLPFDGGAGMGY